MKFTKIAIAAVFALSFGRAYAFHSGGVAECDGCHTMHNSETLDANTASQEMNGNGPSRGVGTTGPFLLQGSDPSSTCLICHGKAGAGSYHIYNPGVTSTSVDVTAINYTPGGDFGWLKRDWLFTNHGEVSSSPGMRHGHSIVASDFGLTPDSRLAPPGATDPKGGAISQAYTGANFSCVACHDPHGKKRLTSTDTFVTTGSIIVGSGSYGGAQFIPGADPNGGTAQTAGAYRLLGGATWAPKWNTTANADSFTPFVAEPPIALAPGSYNRSETSFSGLHSNGMVTVVYGSGMSEWCQNCHPAMHSDQTASPSGTYLRHPAGSGAKMSATVQNNYNSYVASGNANGGANNYDSLVPFETGQSRATINSTNAPNNGTYVAIAANGSSNPMCLTCHRAHANAFNQNLRWYMDSEFTVKSGAWASEPTGGRTSTEIQAGMYLRPASAYATFQRVLCNKCHMKD